MIEKVNPSDPKIMVKNKQGKLVVDKWIIKINIVKRLKPFVIF